MSQERAQESAQETGRELTREAGRAEDLRRLLQRCHKDELIPLARMLRVDTRLGLGSLADSLEITLRRKASHGIGNVLRRGEGREYGEILREVAEKLGVSADNGVGTAADNGAGAAADNGAGEAERRIEALERAVLRRWFVKRWEREGPEARQVLWQRMGLTGEAPVGGVPAVEEAERRLGRGVSYWIGAAIGGVREKVGWAAVALGLSPLGCLLGPLRLPLFLWYALRPPEEAVQEWVVEVARLRQIVLHRVTVGVVGSPSSGKDALIRTVFGIDTGNISPIAGSTKQVGIHQLPGSTALFVVNTPGMGDVIEQVTEEARQVLDHIDLYVYVVNAEGGVQAREKADYDRCVASGRPVLAVVNKIDVLRPRDKEKYLADARKKLGAEEADFVAAAVDPLPELSPGPINIGAIHGWLRERLESLGKRWEGR